MRRIQPTRENLTLMLDMMCSFIETKTIPSPDSPFHHTMRWMVDDSGYQKPRRKRIKLSLRKPRKFHA